MNSSQQMGVSGCRLSDGRLHLGHYLGCLHPEKTKQIGELFFVIQDGKTNYLAGKPPSVEPLALLLAQLYAFCTEDCTIVPCLQSKIFPAYAPLFDFARAVITLRGLERVHPKKDDLKAAFGIPLRDYLFPVDQAVQFLAFGADFILMNDDNIRFARLANNLHKKLTTAEHRSMPAPRMALDPVPRLLGSNGQKMSKANGNCIFLTDDDRTVTEQIRNYARRIGWRWTRDCRWEYEGEVALSEEIGSGSALASICFTFQLDFPDLRLAVESVPDLIEHLIKRIVPLISDVRARTHEAMKSKGLLFDRLAADSTRATHRIANTIGALI